MLTNKVFLTSDVEGLPSNSIQTMDAAKALELEKEGKGVVIADNKLDEIERNINKAVDDYRKKYTEMTTSENPVYKVEGAIDYYASEMKEQLEREIKELNEQYSMMVHAMKEEAMKDIANKRRYISDDERKAARDVVSEVITAIKFGDGRGALETLIDQAPYMNETRKFALLQEIARINEAATGHVFERALHDGAKRLYRKLDEVRDGETLAVKIAQALPTRVDTRYRTLKMTHPSFKGIK
jgi:hypothetical protein